jgi:hypothetical protein
MFHVKHDADDTSAKTVNDSFTNTEIAEDRVQDILDINSANESAKNCCRRSEPLSDQLLASLLMTQSAIERCHGLSQRLPMPAAGDQHRFRRRKVLRSKFSKRLNQLAYSLSNPG